MSGTAAVDRERRGPLIPMTITQETPSMSSTTRRTGPAATYLVHFFGGGLVDRGECYAVERFPSAPCSMLAITECVCSNGSRFLEVSCRNVATTVFW